MNMHEEADQVAFFDTMYTSAKRAELQAGHIDRHYSVAARSVHLRIAGQGFSDKLPTALNHLAQAPSQAHNQAPRGSPSLTIHAWDDNSTQTLLPKLMSRYLDFVQMHCFDYLGSWNEMLDFHG